MGPRCSCVKSSFPATAKDDHPGPTAIFQSWRGGFDQFAEICGPRERPARSAPRKAGHSAFARASGATAALALPSRFLAAESELRAASIVASAEVVQRQRV